MATWDDGEGQLEMEIAPWLTRKQIAFLDELLRHAEDGEQAEAIRKVLNRAVAEADKLTKAARGEI